MNTMLRPQEPEPPFEPEARQRRGRNRGARIAAAIAAANLALLVLIGVGFAILLNTTGFHNYVLSKAESIAGEQLGVRVRVQNFALHLSTLTLDLYGITVAGANPYPDPPLLQLQHAEVGATVVSLFHREWYLRSVRLDRPVVQILVDKNGVSNLPHLKSADNGSKGNSSLFDLGIRNAVIDQGFVLYNNREIPLAANLNDLEVRATYAGTQQKYSADLSYRNGELVVGGYRPFQHDFAAKFDYTPTTFQLRRATISSGASQINIAGELTNFNAPSAQLQYGIVVDGGQMAKLLNDPSIPTGLIHADGSAQYQYAANEPPLNTVALSGDVTSPRLVVTRGPSRATIEDLAAHYSLDRGNATLHDLHARLLGGEVTAQGAMKDVGGNRRAEMTAEARGLSVAEATRIASPSAAGSTGTLTGLLNAKVTAAWSKAGDDLVAHADATIHGTATPGGRAAAANASSASAPPGSTIPVDSQIHATYTAADSTVAVSDSYLRTPQTSLTMHGVVSKHSSLTVDLEANDLREIAAIAERFRGPAQGQPFSMAGRASFHWEVSGAIATPHIAGQLNATDLQVNGTGWKVFRAQLDADPSQATVRNAHLEALPKGTLALTASVGLNKWAFNKTAPLSVNLDASQLNIEDLEKLAGQRIPVEGTLSAHIALHGSANDPAGNGNIALTKLRAYGEPADSARVDFDGDGNQANATLAVRLPAGALQAKVNVHPKERTFVAQLSSTGIALENLEAVKTRGFGLTGEVALNASGQGSFDNPQLKASLRIPLLSVQKRPVQNVDLELDVANHVADATLDSSAAQTAVKGRARVNLTGDLLADASIDTQAVPLQPLLAAYLPASSDSLEGETEVHATLHGPLRNKNLVEAHITVPYLKLAYGKTIQLAAAAPLHADYAGGVLTVQRGAIQGTDTDLHFQGRVPMATGGSISLMLQGTVNLQLAQLLDPDLRTSGEARFNIDFQGTGVKPGGEIDIVDASYASADLPVGLQHANGVLKLSPDRVDVSSFKGTVGGGTVTASGGVALRPSVQFDLGLTAQNIRMIAPAGMREAVDAHIHLAGTPESATLGGAISLADVSFTPGFDLNSLIAQVSGGVASPPSQGMAQNIKLNLAIHSTNGVNLVSRTLSVNGAANLQVRGTVAEPVILGRVNLTGGDILLNNDRFVLNGGTIQFVNPMRTEPVVNLSIATTIQQYNIDLRLSGPVDHLQTQYTSDPALPQADIIHLLAFGQTTEASAVSGAGVSPTQTGESLVASQVSSQITSRISRVAGISQLSINPVLGNGNNQSNGANITVQQRVTGNLFVTFSDNTATTQNETIQGQYRISPRVSVSATRDPNGGFAVDALIKKTW